MRELTVLAPAIETTAIIVLPLDRFAVVNVAEALAVVPPVDPVEHDWRTDQATAYLAITGAGTLAGYYLGKSADHRVSQIKVIP